MKGIILCGGLGTRLQPITYTIPKQLIPIANKPLLIYTIELLLKSGIEEIGIIVNEYNKTIFQKVLDKYFVNKIEYIVQKSPKGISHGLLFAEEFIGEDKFVMVLGDNSFNFELNVFVSDFNNSKENCRIMLKDVSDPERYGVAYIGDGKIIDLEEKPKLAFSNWAITGIYAFDSTIFKACKEILPSNRGEYEITDAIKWLLKNNYNVSYSILKGYWRDVGNPMEVIAENFYRLISIEENISGEIVDSKILGPIILDDNSVLFNSIVRGPVAIGDNTIIKNSYIGPYTSIGKGVNIEKSVIENSIVLNNSKILGVKTLIDSSIIGEDSIITMGSALKKTNKFIIGKGSKIYL